MNKYELTVVVNAMTEDDVRTAVIEKVKDLVAKCGGTITAVDEAGKKKLAYEIQKMNEAFYYFFSIDAGMGLFHFNNIVHFKIHINTCLILKTRITLPDKNITPTTNVIDVIIISDIEASDGFEPTIRVLQTHALPLG